MRTVCIEGDNIAVNEYPADKVKRLTFPIAVEGYVNLLMTFDIETSVISVGGEDRGIMYVWQACVGTFDGKHWQVYVGRTWKDYKAFCNELRRTYHLRAGACLPVYVHFLGYEFQWLRSILRIEKLFAVKERVPVKFTSDYGAFEYRCSYKMSNMSLAKFCKEEKAKHGKLEGFDYLKTRYPDTPLDDFELSYCVDDVLGLYESICHSLRITKDSARSVPLTSTGYIRRESRDAMRSNPDNYFNMLRRQLNVDTYCMCKGATRGGNTHTNPLYAKTILYDMIGYDKSSSYPHQMTTKLYPMHALKEERGGQFVKDAANIVFLRLWNVQIKAGVYFPYIAASKCKRLLGGYTYVDGKGRERRRPLLDNGRVVKADYIELVVTEIDWQIIVSQYDFDEPEIVSQYCSEYGMLPKEYREFILEMYQRKCELKNGDPYFYAKYKNKINALFGMMLTDVCREDVFLDSRGQWDSEIRPLATLLYEYYHSKGAFLSYQDGIYVTAHARADLQEGLDLVGIDGIYCDTDSVKCFRGHEAGFAALNEKIIAHNIECGVKPVVIGEDTYNLGVWELDSEYDEFVAYGAKKYAYKYKEGTYKEKDYPDGYGITVAGLSKKKGAEYLRKVGGLEAFKEGLVFDEANSGRMKAIYHDTIEYRPCIVNGHKVELTSDVALVPTTYTLGIGKDYAALLEMRDEIFM